jgi:hypothetical protein
MSPVNNCDNSLLFERVVSILIIFISWRCVVKFNVRPLTFLMNNVALELAHVVRICGKYCSTRQQRNYIIRVNVMNRMALPCWIIKYTVKNTEITNYLIPIIHKSNYSNAPQFYVIRTLCDLLAFCVLYFLGETVC